MMPFQPEPLAALQARYPKALEHVFNIRTLLLEGGPRPGESRANMFDFEDGLRMLVSREIFKLDGTIALHVSASFNPESRIADEMRKAPSGPGVMEGLIEKFAASIPTRFAELSGDKLPLRFLGVSPGGNPQFLREEASVPK